MRGVKLFHRLYAERRGCAGKPQKIGGKISAGVKKRLSIVGAEQPFCQGKYGAGKLGGKSALFEHLKKAQPNAINGKQGKGKRARLFRAR